MRTVILVGPAILIAALMTTAIAPAPSDARPPQTAAQPCIFRPEALQGICSDVRMRNSESYERKIFAASCVNADVTEPERSRISETISNHLPLCDGYDLAPRSNILKYAVASRTQDFLYVYATVWRGDLNVVDVDGTTVLDYVDTQLRRNVGRSNEAELRGYRDMLIRAGARTSAQLEAGEDCRPSTRCRQ